MGVALSSPPSGAAGTQAAWPPERGQSGGSWRSVLRLSSRLASLRDVQNKMAKGGSAVAQARASLRGATKADGQQPGS